jgi:hypothetical protein
MATEYHQCQDCVCWHLTSPDGHSVYKEGYGRCTRKAPSPCQKNGSAHDEVPGIRNVDWPHTYKHEGCWESKGK